MSKWLNLFSWIAASIGILILENCASLSSYQTAKTLDAGEVSATFGTGHNHLADESFGDAALRLGIGNQADLGIKYNKTGLGSQLLLLDIKKQISKDETLNSAVGFGISPIWENDQGIAFHLPYYASVDIADELVTVYTNPRLLYYISTDDQSNSSLGFGNSLGLKVGKRLSVMPEWSFVMGEPRGAFDINHLFSIGVGINVK